MCLAEAVEAPLVLVVHREGVEAGNSLIEVQNLGHNPPAGEGGGEIESLNGERTTLTILT